MSNNPQLTIDSFTRQADGYAESPQINDEQALRLVLDLTAAGPDDVALDVACGPGTLTCALAGVVCRACGIDLTPAMIDRARRMQQDKGLRNVEWRVGDVRQLPWPDGSFSLVVSRYALHHVHEPLRVLSEMRRVCRPGGRVAVIDVALPDDDEAAREFNRMERLRDPSHVRALTRSELAGLFAADLPLPRTAGYRLEFELEALLAGSFPQPGSEPTIRRMFHECLKSNSMGLNAEIRGEDLWFSYPIMVLVANTDPRRGTEDD